MMQNVRSGDHLELIGETWYYRREVPRDVRHAFGVTKVRISLETKSRTVAKRLEKKPDAEFEEKLAAARGKRPDGLPRDPELRAKQLAGMLFTPALTNDPDLDSAILQIPQSDRSGVVREITTELQKLRSHMETPEFWLDFWRLHSSNNGNIKSIVPELVERFRSRAEERHTLDWAYEEWSKAKHRPQQTQDEARRYLDDFKRSAHVQGLAAVRRRHVTDWREELKREGALAPKSINHRLEIVSAILRVGWREAEIPAADLKNINVPEPATSDRTSWTNEEILEEMDLLAPQSWGAWLYIIGLTTGSRIGEPIAARKEWYDPLGFIRVPAEFTKMKKPHVIPIIELIRPSWRPMYPSSHPAITYSMRRDPRTQI
jgi:hypothetical protein